MIFAVIIALIFLFEGLRRSSRFVFLVFEWRQSQDWPSTQGIIVQSRLISTDVPRGGRKNYNLDGSIRLVSVDIPDIVVEYRVNGEVFQSNRISMGQQFPAPQRVTSEFMEKYPLGKEVAVFFNPEKPGMAVMEQSSFKKLFGHFVGGVVYLALGFGLLILLFLKV